MTNATARPRRSVLYMPGSKPRALDKARGLPCDAIIFDLEDAVTPEEKVSARETLARVALEQGEDVVAVLALRGRHIDFDAIIEVEQAQRPLAVTDDRIERAEDPQALRRLGQVGECFGEIGPGVGLAWLAAVGWQGYLELRRIVAGLDWIVGGMAFFGLAAR